MHTNWVYKLLLSYFACQEIYRVFGCKIWQLSDYKGTYYSSNGTKLFNGRDSPYCSYSNNTPNVERWEGGIWTLWRHGYTMREYNRFSQIIFYFIFLSFYLVSCWRNTVSSRQLYLLSTCAKANSTIRNWFPYGW